MRKSRLVQRRPMFYSAVYSNKTILDFVCAGSQRHESCVRYRSSIRFTYPTMSETVLRESSKSDAQSLLQQASYSGIPYNSLKTLQSTDNLYLQIENLSIIDYSSVRTHFVLLHWRLSTFQIAD